MPQLNVAPFLAHLLEPLVGQSFKDSLLCMITFLRIIRKNCQAAIGCPGLPHADSSDTFGIAYSLTVGINGLNSR